MGEILSYQFVQNAILAGLLASLLCGLVGTFVVVRRLVFVSGGVSHAAFGGLGCFYYFGLPPLLGAATAAVLAAVALSRREEAGGRSQDAVIGILWAVGMAVGVVFIARSPGFTPNLMTYLFGDILAVSRGLLVALALLTSVVVLCIVAFFKELLAVSFDEEYARSQGVATRSFLLLLMVLIALSVVLLIQVVGAVLAIALLTIPPTISLSMSSSFRAVMLTAIAIGLVMTMGGLWLSFSYDLPSGPTIVLLGFALLVLSRGFQRLRVAGGRMTGGAGPATALLVASLLALSCRSGSVPANIDGPDEPSKLPPATSWAHIEFLGEAEITASNWEGAPLGGLSGLIYDAETGLYHAVSDDRAENGPARFFTLEIDLSSGQLTADGVRPVALTTLTTTGGRAFEAGKIDPEAIALLPTGHFIVASEGDARIELAPFLREFDRDGVQVRDLPLGQRYAPRRDSQSGVRYNLALESASIVPGGRFLYSATENALEQDGPRSDLAHSSPGRILRYDLEASRLDAEFLYWIEPVSQAPAEAGAFSTNGVVELVALDANRLLVLERSFSIGRGNDVRIYEVDVSAATDIRSIDGLEQSGTEDLVAAEKRLLMHVNRLGIEPDNLEGMAFGPALPDGRPTLLLLSDNNFNREQINQVLAFALGTEVPDVGQVQGQAHRSPFEGDWVRRIEGVVTAVDTGSRNRGFWLQQADSDAPPEETGSRALFVAYPEDRVRVGDRVEVSGAVLEVGFSGQLSVTRIAASEVQILESGVTLPTPIRLGVGGRTPPRAIIDDDELTRFDPCCDAIDFFESLEGMRVEVDRPVVVGATTRYGEIVVLADDGEQASDRTSRGGIILRSSDPNPERIVLDDRLTPEPPSVMVGDSFSHPVRGVLDYDFSNFKLLVEAWPAVVPAGPVSAPPLSRTEKEITVASYNVLNLNAGDSEEKFAALAENIVRDLASPTIIGLQEVQDNNGAKDEQVVAADLTLGRLVEAIVEAGGPRYEYRQRDPRHNEDSGQPNGNIRVVWLFDPELVEVKGEPQRLGEADVAFAGDESRGWEGGRKCLAIDAVFAQHTIGLINCHLKSKRGDDRLFGSNQPPRFHSEEQRSAQVQVLLDHVAERQSTDPEAKIIVLGDMNEHEFRPPMQLLAESRLINLTERVPQPDRYSYNFLGNSQLLDHILVTENLGGRVTDVQIVHVNADRADAQRSSDHDPVLIRLSLD